MARDTTTGSAYEEIVETCLKRASKRNGFDAFPQRNVGLKPNGGSHRIDWELVDQSDENIRGLVSCKYQGTSGTAEEKIAYEVIKLLFTMKIDPRYKHGWLVMGGDGWTNGMKVFVNSDLKLWIPEMAGKVSIFTTDQLINAEIKLPN